MALSGLGVSLFCLLLFGISAVVGLTNIAAPPNNEDRLLADLFEGYNPNARPVWNDSKPIRIMTSFSLMSFDSVDDRSQSVSVVGVLNLLWTDAHLMWNPADYGGVTEIYVPCASVWRPDVGLLTTTDNTDFHLKEYAKQDVKIISYGSVYSAVQWLVSKIFTFRCKLDLTIFPFDSQYCQASFGSLSQKANTVYYTASDGTSDRFATPNTEWYLVKLTASSAQTPHSILLSGTFYNWTESSFSVSFSLKRRTGYYWVNLITPCMCCSFLVAMTFYMPCDAGEKLSFSVTVLLAFTVYQLIIADNLPRSSERTPLLSIYLTLLTGLSASAVTLAMFVLNLHHHDPNKPVPNWVKTQVYGYLATITCKRKAVRKLGLDSLNESNQVQHISIQNPRQNVASDEDASKSSSTNRHAFGKDLLKEHIDGNTIDGDGAYGPHWKLAADIFDRFFLILFLIFTVTLTIVIMFIIPSFYVGGYLESEFWY